MLTLLSLVLTIAGLVVRLAGGLVSSLRNPVVDAVLIMLLVDCFVVVMMLGVTVHCSLSAPAVRARTARGAPAAEGD